MAARAQPTELFRALWWLLVLPLAPVGPSLTPGPRFAPLALVGLEALTSENPAAAARGFGVVAADHGLRGIPLEAGDREIEFEYRPRSLRLSAWISAIALASLFVFSRRARMHPPVS